MTERSSAPGARASVPGDEPTSDPFVVIEARPAHDVIQYRNKLGERWQVIGTCTRCGKCWEGAVNPAPVLDSPVTPSLKNCPALTFKVLPKAEV